MSLGPGAVVGGYRIERVLGVGGMGTVYLAGHPSLPRRDALKVLSVQLSQDREYRSRFEREANTAATLDHPNIVSVYNRGEDHGQLWIAMQFVDGTDAEAARKRDPQAMTPARALRIVTEVGRGLDHAHRRGLLHRDVKPANFMLSEAGSEEERVLLADFGLAKSAEDTNELTQTGSFVATIAYASPEQLSGEQLDRRTDIYSLACSFYKLITGQNPYPATQPALVMMGHLSEPPPRVTAVLPDLPAALDEVLAVAMAKDPAERFADCHQLTQALDLALNRGVSPLSMRTRPGSFATPVASRAAVASATLAKRAVWQRYRTVAAAAGVSVALAAGIGVWAVRGHESVASSPTQQTPATSAAAARSVAEARQQNPVFLGKTIAVVDISGEGGWTAGVAVHLKPSPQAAFFERLGFVYHNSCVRIGDEPTPRPIDTIHRTEPSVLSQIESGYLLAVRSDTAAGGGGQLNLPPDIRIRSATVLILDDPTAVDALRNWTDHSEQILLDKLLPVLRKSVK
ncbi:serine/threonine-protein kinase [Nocardia sp. NPDC051030]|uniref:serine/threonine-protein kinase n=1 Tax=Nocardia sp. NPDC051030 TaxID=3155162 RepID=UPI00341D4ADC